MLPIRSPFDTYRAGLWVVRRNSGLILAYLALMTASDLLFASLVSEEFVLSVGSGTIVVILLASFVALFLVLAMLIYPLHASFLSDGRVTGLAAIEGFGRLCRIGWRSFVILILALIPTAVFVVLAVLLLDIGMEEIDTAVTAAEMGDSAAEASFAMSLAVLLLIFGLFFGTSVILLGLRIPEIVDKADMQTGSSSFRRGARDFLRMAANLAAGPGLVLVVQDLVKYTFIVSPSQEVTRDPYETGVLVSDFVALAVYAFCVAMTAGVLSDAYRRALARDAQSRAA